MKAILLYVVVLLISFFIGFFFITQWHMNAGFFTGISQGMVSILLFPWDWVSGDHYAWTSKNNGGGYYMGFIIGMVMQVPLLFRLIFWPRIEQKQK